MNTRLIIILLLVVSYFSYADTAADLAKGKELEQAGEYGRAVEYLLRAAKSGTAPKAYIMLGLCYEKLVRKGNALWAYGQVSGDAQYGAEAIYYMAQLYVTEKRYQEAARVFLSVAKYHPGSRFTAPAWERAGWCLQKAGKKRRAYEVYLTALEQVERQELRQEIRQRIKKMGYYVGED